MPKMTNCSECKVEIFVNKNGMCWECYRDKKFQRSIDNKQQTLENRRTSRLNWYYNNREHAKAKATEWKQINKDKVKEYKQEHIVERRAYVETRRARLLEADEGVTSTIWKLLIDLYDNRCAYCFEKFGSLEQDHVIPLSKGGKHSVTNVVPACLPCNRIKSISLIEPVHPMYEFIKDRFSESILPECVPYKELV